MSVNCAATQRKLPINAHLVYLMIVKELFSKYLKQLGEMYGDRESYHNYSMKVLQE